MLAVLGGALIAMAVVGMMMSGASSVGLEAVSDPEAWMAIHHHGGESEDDDDDDDDDDMEAAAGSQRVQPEAEPRSEESEWVKHYGNRIRLIFRVIVDEKHRRWGRRHEPQIEHELATWTTDAALKKTFLQSRL